LNLTDHMRTVLPFVLLAFLVFDVTAQQSYMGFKGGFNLSKFDSEGISDIEVDDRKAYNFAFVYSFISRTNPPLGLTIEPGYTLKGTRFKTGMILNDTLRAISGNKLHYISLPVLFDFYPIKNLKISVGPEVAFLAKTKLMIADTTQSISSTYNKRWELSGTVGISYSIDFFVDLGLRYNTAFTKVAEMDAILNRQKLFNQYLQVYLMFKIAN